MYDKRCGAATMSANEPNEDHDLLSSPLGKSNLSRAFVIGGPIALLVTIFVSLWVSFLHVRHTSIVQVETTWEPGERLALRARLLPESPGPVRGISGAAWVERGTQQHHLPDFAPTGRDGVTQVSFEAPDWQPGPATLQVRLWADGTEIKHEALDVNIVETRAARRGASTVAQSTLQWADDSDPQPPGMRISIRPDTRLVSDFDNRVFVRVLHVDGRPYVGPVEVMLAGGEFMGKRANEEPVSLLRTETNALGVVTVEGMLTSEVLRLEARVLEREAPNTIRMKRRQRFVSFSGAVELRPSTEHTLPSTALEIEAFALLRKPVFVDVHGADGGWIDTFTPPMLRPEPPRAWSHPGLEAGVLQFEAYHFTNNPGESTAVRRVQVFDGDPGNPKSLAPLIALHRDTLDEAKVESDYDADVERAYLEWIANAKLTGPDVEEARSYLLGTLPLDVFGAPTALVTRDRELSTLAAKQHKWTIGLRFVLLGGGGLFLAAMTFFMVRSHGQAAEATLRELSTLSDEEERALSVDAISRAKRQALWRGLGVIAVMAAALVLTTVMLESFLWIF